MLENGSITDKQERQKLEYLLNISYFFDPYEAIIEQYDTARIYAQIMAKRLNLTISEKGQLVKKPHIAFEYDMICVGALSPYFILDIGLLTKGTATLIPVKIKRFVGMSLGSAGVPINNLIK